MADTMKDKKRAVLDATLELITQQGLHATPMSQIALKANIGMGTIYRYFPSKEELIKALYLEKKAALIKYLLGSYKPESSVADSFIALLRSLLSYYTENPMELLFAEQCENSPMITPEIQKEGMHSAGVLLELFDRAQAEKLLKDIPFDVLGALLGGAVISLAKLCMSGSIQLGSQVFEASLDAVWDMIRR
jgi:AcrR family transcriptional regulator